MREALHKRAARYIDQLQGCQIGSSKLISFYAIPRLLFLNELLGKNDVSSIYRPGTKNVIDLHMQKSWLLHTTLVGHQTEVRDAPRGIRPRPPPQPREAERQGCPTSWHSCRASSVRPHRNNRNRCLVRRSSSFTLLSTHRRPCLHPHMIPAPLCTGLVIEQYHAATLHQDLGCKHVGDSRSA